jgi:hypothetical protein
VHRAEGRPTPAAAHVRQCLWVHVRHGRQVPTRPGV